jgi:4,5:9,10-diseco-3-hydroxy-5,9,17-trioxoandrosta-1(10),2-diene-4-oate hydrolase
MAIESVPEGNFAELPNGLKVHYHEAGEGPAVMFVHGSGPGATGWSNFKGNYEEVAEAGYRVIVPDLVGFGLSSCDDDLDYSWELLRDALIGLMDELDLDDVALVGNSMGGAFCIQLALDIPERINRLVLMAPGGLEEREVYMEMEGISTMLRIMYKEGVTKDSMRSIFKLQLFDESLITDQIINERYEVYQRQPKNILGKVKVPNLSTELENLDCPVLGVWGRDDKFCPSSGAWKVSEKCPVNRVVVVSQCGHWVQVEHEDLFNRLCIDFLNNG